MNNYNKKAEMAVEFKNVYYKYPGTKNWIVKDICFKIPKNSFHIIVGPTGSGKTTLLTLARGFYKEYGGHFDGDIYILNQNIKDSDIGRLGYNIGIVFQNPSTQLHQLRVIDEIMSSPIYQGLPWQECKKRAETIMNRILHTSFYNRSPNDLSYGEQQKVALAACLSMRCKILLLDEPFSFLDPNAVEEILNILLELKKGGKTIVLATHNLEQVAGYADRITLINNGRLVLEGAPKEILYSDNLEEILTAPLSIKAAKALIKREKLEKKVVNWQDLFKEVKFKLKNRKMTKCRIKRSTILKFENISYTYPEGAKGIKDISLDIYKGEIIGIIGANGSGKTTIAKIALGLLNPDKGKIYLLNKDITKVSTSERAKKIGYVTQDPVEMLFENTVLEECASGPKFLGIKNPKQIAKKTLNKLKLLRYKEKHPDSLSGGEKKLLTIADILANKPEILILDEPEFGLDPKTWGSIAYIIKKLKKEGKTIILITHNLEIAVFLCNRIFVMDKGRISEMGDTAEIYTNLEFLQKSNLLYVPLFKILKTVSKDRRFLNKEEFIDTLLSSASEIK